MSNANEALAFGRTLRKYRTAKGFKQQEFADKAGVNNSYLSRIECGERMPSGELINSFAKVLGVEVHDLLVAAGIITNRDARILSGNSTGDDLLDRIKELEKRVDELTGKFDRLQTTLIKEKLL